MRSCLHVHTSIPHIAVLGRDSELRASASAIPYQRRLACRAAQPLFSFVRVVVGLVSSSSVGSVAPLAEGRGRHSGASSIVELRRGCTMMPSSTKVEEGARVGLDEVRVHLGRGVARARGMVGGARRGGVARVVLCVVGRLRGREAGDER